MIVTRTTEIGVIVTRTIEINPNLIPKLLPNLLRTGFEILNYFANEQTKHQFFDSCLLKICPGVFTSSVSSIYRRCLQFELPAP